jgi:hypothetical protein
MNVVFNGGIIINSNEDLARCSGVMQAVASRFKPQLWDLSIEERICCILDIADQGFKRGSYNMTAEQCREVARFLIEELTSNIVGKGVDLRTFTEHACPAFCQANAGECVSSWKEMVRAKLTGEVKLELSRADKAIKLEDLALEIADSDRWPKLPEKLEFWGRSTGLAQAQYYRHLKAARARRQLKK